MVMRTSGPAERSAIMLKRLVAIDLSRHGMREGVNMTTSVTRTWLAAAVALLFATAAFAPVTVTPAQSQVGATQVYKVRIHAEGKTATTGVDLAIPDGIT